MLTGFADLHTATKAVNQGQVFRFLTKPCPPRDLAEALEESIKYHNFIINERELIDLKRWRRSLEQMVAALARLVESRDPYTAGHQQRVALLSMAIAQGLKLDEQTIDTVRLAATIHDIGKVYVPLEFLTKPGSLSSLELDVIQTHPQVGYEILKPIEFESPISRIVLQHHERLDGSGYPQGLKGSEILEESKIIAVADVVEAMCSHRPYRPSRGLSKALREIKQKRGLHYEPKIVDMCIELFEKEKFSFHA
jgi:putative nucleotidyltransferase with HDIG domain